MSVLYVLCAILVKSHRWSQEKVVIFENLTNLTHWPQPASILIVKIQVLELQSYRKPISGPAQLTGIDIEPKIEQKSGSGSTSSQNSSQKVDRDRHRAKNRAKGGEIRLTKRN